ncbi:MAG: aldo/keto reductase [Prolixibacteraceae bacterium]
MLYRKFGKTGEMVSILGFGCMRLPLIPGGDASKINEELSTELIRYAIDEGVNYIDTAYPYHGKGMGSAGRSEPVVGKILRDGYRQKVKLATKLPSWLINSRSDMDRILNEQLERLETDHIDFYLVHALNKSLWKHVKDAGIARFLEQAIHDGKIRYAGFSYHDEQANFNGIVDAFDWSFCQIQYNYMDEEFQAGRKGLEYAALKGLGIIIMEPLRGGKLAQNHPESVQTAFSRSGKNRTPADWALGWIWNHPEVSLLISGMNSMEQVTGNLKSAENAIEGSFSDSDNLVIEKVKNIYRQRIKVDCTACGYCMPCPSGVDIPGCFNYFNNFHMYGKEDNYRFLKAGQRASDCTECGSCEAHCPQSLPIPELLKDVRAVFEPA